MAMETKKNYAPLSNQKKEILNPAIFDSFLPLAGAVWSIRQKFGQASIGFGDAAVRFEPQKLSTKTVNNPVSNSDLTA